MSRLVHTLGVVAAATLLSFPFAATAQAATGTLIINFVQVHEDPSEGCLQQEDGYDLIQVTNNTDQRAYVFSDYDCRGYQTTIVHPGETKSGSLGLSLYIR
ncbi:unnamed protein product [[Actinomadura] parvosata subsp. kistnae]|uniref:Uncharacterized protein n=1 Tax=[Actinomadura] parvosata subsp. kistnae TaxID=1909395 RepID=A0A1U9ZWI8_9ACTN|nr:hypothetical protein [Nonomuraea sp. ATCC 55076]AQZ62326.1 hypothetical protein BKM31_13395 [Nonomuraea sp. ATCC 55076]SPL99664.1 unnamed protein product [Actinomadura parvosata subsp. kistnae]